MSIRTNPMKAVPTLLKRLVRVEKQANLNDLKSELNKIKNQFWMVKKNEEELLDTLAVVDGYIRNKNIRKLTEEEGHICQRIRISTKKLLPAGDLEAAGSSGKTFQDAKVKHREDMNRELPSSSQLEDLEMIKVNYYNLGRDEKRCFSSLLQFPENTVMKRREIILWCSAVLWGGRPTGIGNRSLWFLFVHESVDHWFDSLLKSKVIVPYGNGKSPIASKFKINPLVRNKSLRPLLQNEEEHFCYYYSQIMTSSHQSDIRYKCLALDQHKIKISDESGFTSNRWNVVLNVGASYLNFGPGWMNKMKHLEVLQLGRWLQDSPKHHIEVASEEFLKELRGQKNLRHLSLRGISRIFELPPFIFQLENLEILDLKACHNLETLPSDISPLRYLIHLDLSQCYLLDRMPKGIESLIRLQVLKGFVLGSSSKTPCRISNLANLKYLNRFSIRIVSGAVIQGGEFQSLKELSKLEHLKISWGVFDTRYTDIQISFPSSLKKLHLEGFPGQNIPEWLKPSKLPSKSKESELSKSPEALTELHITGGKLTNLDHGENNINWGMEIVHLKYLKHLNVDLTNLQELFPMLRFVEIKQILNQSYFKWSIA